MPVIDDKTARACNLINMLVGSGNLRVNDRQWVFLFTDDGFKLRSFDSAGNIEESEFIALGIGRGQ